MTIEEMQQKKRQLGVTYEQIAEKAGLSAITVQRVMNGTTPKPRGYTKEFIEMALSELSVREHAPQFAYMEKQQGEYTAEDYFALPDEERCELIDGVIYDFASPTDMHQDIAGELFFQLKTHVKENGGPCRVKMAPSDVRIGDNTVVQPDVYIYCKGWKKGEEAPAFVAEVISPSTKKKDYLIKLKKYQESGAREYWILDPDIEKIIAYVFDGEEWQVAITDLYAPMPVSIWNGECVVDLSSLKKELEEYESAEGYSPD